MTRRNQFSLTILISPFCVFVYSALTIDAQDSANGVQFFESKIRPVLVKNCYECHSNESGKAKGGLKVDSKQSIRRGGDTGPAIAGKSLTKSLLFQSITYEGDYQMPPKGKLPDDVIADFRKWILMGAPDPRTTKAAPAIRSTIDIEEGRMFWSYQAPKPSPPPESENSNWARTNIDRFIVNKLDEKGLVPVQDADPRTLIRRVYFTLIGLPPTPDKLNFWLSRIEVGDESQRQEAFADLVDELLESKAFGERWGRHWMDVVRFAESTGGDKNNIFQHAWRYRDWIIDSFNDDKPYDQFIREQLAGDLLPISNDMEWANNIIATGFLAVGVKLVGEEDQQKYFADLVDEQIDATSRAFLGTSIACARCHDHKFDPIPQTDYYAMAGIFRATQTHYGLLQAQARQSTTLIDLTGLGPPAGSQALSKKEYEKLVAARNDARKTVDDAMKKIRSGENVFRGTLRRIRSQRDEAEMKLRSYTTTGAPRVFAMGTQDRDFPLTTRVLLRGELDKPAQVVSRGVPQVLSEKGRYRFRTSLQGSGRLELANWIVSKDNPLTARVMANRIWHWMFGRGIVRTVDEFGSTGDRPTHSELLDYLSIQFVKNGWSTKKLIREIALSRTWQLSSTYAQNNFDVDPDNQYLWRAHKRRLEAEVIRDSMLLVSGNLETKRFRGTMLHEVGEGNVGQNVFEPVIRAIDSNHRSVYLPRVRNALPEVLELFDAPDASLVAGERKTTASPLQSLYLMNNEFVQRQAATIAARVAEVQPNRRIAQAYLLAFGRTPSETESKFAVQFMTKLNGSSLSTQQKLAAFCQALICTAEFKSID